MDTILSRVILTRFETATWALLVCLCFASQSVLAHSGDDEAFVQADSAAGLSEVSVDALAKDSIGLSTTAVKLSSVNDMLRATGEVQAAETQAFEVNPPVSGVVQTVYVKQGDYVKKGQLLSTVYSPEVATALSQLVSEVTRIKSAIARVKAQYESDITLQENQLKLADLAFNREKDLLKEGITARKTYQESEGALSSAQVKLSTLKKRLIQETALLNSELAIAIRNSTGQLGIMGISKGQVERALKSGKVTAELDIHAPVTGYITFRGVTLGERVEPSRKLFSIVNLDPIWVMVDIYQEQIPQVRSSDHVIIETPSKSHVRGTISSIGSVVDATTKTIHVRIIAENKGAQLRPGMFVTAQIMLGEAKKQAILVPEASIVYQNEVPYIFMFHADEAHYEPVVVKLGLKIGGEVEVLSGIKAGDVIVASGTEQLKAQSLRKPGAANSHSHEKHDDHASHESELTKVTDSRVSGLLTFAAGVLVTLIIGAIGLFVYKARKAKKSNHD